MDTSDYLALLAIFVASLSALYARQAVINSKRANKISLHAHMMAVCEELNSFMCCFKGMQLPDFERLNEFKSKAVIPSQIYFSPDTQNLILDIYERCRLHQQYLTVAEEGGQFNEWEIRTEYSQEKDTVREVHSKAIEETRKAIS